MAAGHHSIYLKVGSYDTYLWYLEVPNSTGLEYECVNVGGLRAQPQQRGSVCERAWSLAERARYELTRQTS